MLWITVLVVLFLSQMYSYSTAYTFFRYDINEKEMHVRGVRVHTHNWRAVHGECLGQCLGKIRCNLVIVDNADVCYFFNDSENSTSITTVYNATRMYKLDRNMNRTDCEKVQVPFLVPKLKKHAD